MISSNLWRFPALQTSEINGQSLRVGDIIAVRSRGKLADLIVAAGKAPVSHVGLLVGLDPPIVLEALTRVRTRPLTITLLDCTSAWLLSPRKLTPNQRRRIVDTACEFSAKTYGYGEMLLQGADAICRTRWFTEHLSFKVGCHPICSYIVAESYARDNLRFGRAPLQSVTPADIFNFALGHRNFYYCVPIL
jgi:hypothetical protein